MLPKLEQIMAKADALTQPPVAFEAFWDGDSNGWFVTLTAIMKVGDNYQDHYLGAMRDGGDLRLFNGQVPPWPEAQLARKAGEELAARFGVPFYFPSPDHPEEYCPRWWEQAQGIPCRRCGILLLQANSYPWPGICYDCHLVEEREARETKWSPEERAGPRCEICGNPAKGWLDSSQLCSKCLDRYMTYQCSRCKSRVLILKTVDHTDMCWLCDLQTRLEAVSESDREAIRTAAITGGECAGIDAVIRLLGWGLHDAVAAVKALKRQIGNADDVNS
jgi:hypothetical protein